MDAWRGTCDLLSENAVEISKNQHNLLKLLFV